MAAMEVAITLLGIGASCCFIVKKAIAKISDAIHIRIAPIPIRMISTAPIKRSSPVVENNPTLVLSESCLSERLIKKVAIMANIPDAA